MAYQVLARKYRPQLFSDVIGQDHVTRTLLNALAQNRIAHGYIFSGHRGIGKTTIARILAAALNCSTPVGSPERPTEEPCRICVNCREISSASRQENSIFEESSSFDVEEIDAATNRGIDDARLLTSKIQTRPTNKSKYKIIILDEAHQITDAAWNALLKTLEEPPDWAIFMFATTQPEDIPQTIRSRCQHFSFHAVKLDDIVGQLRTIATKEELDVDDATLTLLAEAGDGSMRDALSIMDQAIASAPLVDGRPHLEISQVRELMGSVSNIVYEQILQAVHANNSADVLSVVGRLLDAGNGAPQLARQFVRYLRNTIVAKVTGLSPDADATGIAADLLQISPEERNRAARSAALFTEEDLSRFLAIMLRTFDELGYRQEQRFHLELGLLKLVHVQRLIPIEDLLSQIGAKPATRPNTTLTAASANTLGASKTLGAPSSATASSAPKVATATTAPATAATPRPTPPPSPFETDRSRKVPTASIAPQAESTRPEPTPTAGSMALAPAPVPEAPSGPQLVPSIAAAATDSAPSDLDLELLQSALVSALAAVKGQQSASEQIEESTLKLNGTTLEIHTTLSKTMLPVVLNADAERTMKTVLRDQASALTLKLIHGAPVANAWPKKPRVAANGSVAEMAEKHPMVQEARRLFSAEISNVIDLREKE
ncbi:DNA polymerase III subunit gamma/tau [Granulicella sp. L46]|uniref:DNA polymerase III subunit gamma/tau n=1 Tax=Granulicella sp. L46 TaxID=1641865 RepID=UPI00131D16D5|nr:DNA polymerase III subunit gamma/tau [Granulicella sp. L46]